MTLVTKRDSSARLQIVQWAAHIGAVTAEALAVRESCTVASARARLLAAERARLLVRQRPLIDQPSLFTVTRAGMRAAGLRGVEPGRVSAASARHSIVSAQVAAALERKYPDHRVVGERELRWAERERGALLASVRMGSGYQGSQALHRPDLVLWPRASQESLPIAVEVELTVKAPRRLGAICRAWARAHHVAGVLYLIAPEVRRPLERAITGAQASGRIALVGLESLT
jgi:hypothetical protein